MGIVTGLIAATLWLVAWVVACILFDIGLPAAAVGLVAGLGAAFIVGVRLGGPRFRSDPISRLEERERARRRYEASVEALAAGDRRRRMREADEAAEARADARVRELVDRSSSQERPPGQDDATEGERVEAMPDESSGPSRTRSGSRPR